MEGWAVPEGGKFREHAGSVGRRMVGRRGHGSATSLRALLLAHGAVGLAAALVVLKDALRALAKCHEAGVAHGGITPGNVIVAPAGEVRLLGGGSGDGTSSVLTRSAPFYLAPEQWREPATMPAEPAPAGDVYAATVTFFECLAGAPPFYAESAAELRGAHERSAVPLDVLPDPVRELVRRGLAKDPAERPEAWILLGQLAQVAARALGPGWERRGRRELSALLASRRVVPAPVRRGGSAGARHRGPIRLTAVVGGALALAAGLASPPLAVILPVGSIFGSGGPSPVLAFPEPERVATNGQLADRTLSPTVKTAAAKPGTTARPAARSSRVLKNQAVPDAPTTAHGLQRGGSHLGGPYPGGPYSDGPVRNQSPSRESPEHLIPEQPTPESTESASDPSRELPPVNLPAPVQALESILIRTKIQPDLGTDIAKDAPPRIVEHNSGDHNDGDHNDGDHNDGDHNDGDAGSVNGPGSTKGTGLSGWYSGDTDS